MRKFTKHFFLSFIAAVLTLSTIGVPFAGASWPTSRTSRPSPPSVAVPSAPPASELGTTVAEVAARHRLPAPELERRLKKDKRLRIGRGRLMFSEPAVAEFSEQAAPTAVGALAAPTPPPANAFLLHSLPGAKRVIYLDFDGHTMSGNAWTATRSGGANIVAPPFNTDGNASSFSDSERNVIIGAWQRVAEDYAAFDVDVTTQYPGESSITRSSSADEYYGMRVLVSPIASMFGGGGIAYVGVFGAVGDYYKPALVFPEALANMEKYIGEACSHEAGHTLGLYHDGTTSGSSYYSGHGTGETGWAPIMGVGYYRNLSQWSKGEYPLANNKEDDLAIIQSHGLYPRPDDYGNASTSAYAVPSGSSFSLTGMIERNSDVDVFRLTTGAGALAINLSTATRGPNIDLVGELRNSAGTLVASSNPVDQLASSVSANVAAGTYYLTVKGTGKGDLASGYSAYASVGSYGVSGTMTPGSVVQVPPTASAKATPSSGVAPLVTQFDSTLSSDSDGTIVSRYWNFGDGTTSTSANPAHTYANAGTYSAWLTVTDNSGLTATANVIVTVTAANKAPTAAISASGASGVAPYSTTFSGANSTDSDGTISSYTWSFGDGTSGSGVSVSHTYANAGTYTARLTVTDNLGLSATATVNVTVTAPANVAPKAVVSASPLSGVAPLSTTFSGANCTDADGTIASYTWSFGDGTSGSGVSVSHTYTQAGTYTARLTVVDNAGASASCTAVVVVAAAPNVAPKAVVSASPLSGVAPLSTTFSGANSTDSDGTIASYTWSFGDGTSGSGVSVSHAYTKAGTYTARLTVKDNLGLSATANVIIVVTAPPNVAPTARITASPLSGVAPLSTTFSGANSTDSDGTIASYTWSFGDGTSGSGKTLSHVYKNAGIYVATLTVKDNRGALASSSIGIVVLQDTAKTLHVASIQLTVSPYTYDYGVTARVTVVGPDGKPVQGVLVTGTWSGGVSKTGKVTSNSTGNANFVSGRFRGGPLTFTVDSLSKISYEYDLASNVVSVSSVILALK